MNHDEGESQFIELNELIRAALQVETPAEQLGRLEQHWIQQSRADRWRRAMSRVAALAAVLLVALAVSWMLGYPSTPVALQQDLVAHSDPVQSAQYDNVVQPGPVAVPDPVDEPSVSRGRPATAYEQLVLNVRMRQRESMKRGSVEDAVENAIGCLVHDPKTNVEQLLQLVDMKSFYAEPVLLRQLRRADDRRRLAILQLLSRCGTPESTTALLQVSRREVLREEALRTLEKLVGTEGLASAAQQSDDASVRNAIYRRLWEDADALDVCLAIVQNDVLRDEVLAALDEVAPPLVDALLARLDAEEPEVRLAAALVLGHANGPVVTESLIGIVSENPACNSETWIALMACRGPHIDQFLEFAMGQPRLLGSLNRARVYWARITN